MRHLLDQTPSFAARHVPNLQLQHERNLSSKTNGIPLLDHARMSARRLIVSPTIFTFISEALVLTPNIFRVLTFSTLPTLRQKISFPLHLISGDVTSGRSGSHPTVPHLRDAFSFHGLYKHHFPSNLITKVGPSEILFVSAVRCDMTLGENL